jgi:hypothetical protein
MLSGAMEIDGDGVEAGVEMLLEWLLFHSSYDTHE